MDSLCSADSYNMFLNIPDTKLKNYQKCDTPMYKRTEPRNYYIRLSPPWELRIDEYFMKTSMSPITSNSSLHQVLLAPIKTSISPVSVYSLVLVKLKQQLAAESGQLCREDLGQISSHPPWIIYTSPLH